MKSFTKPKSRNATKYITKGLKQDWFSSLQHYVTDEMFLSFFMFSPLTKFVEYLNFFLKINCFYLHRFFNSWCFSRILNGSGSVSFDRHGRCDRLCMAVLMGLMGLTGARGRWRADASWTRKKPHGAIFSPTSFDRNKQGLVCGVSKNFLRKIAEHFVDYEHKKFWAFGK